MEDHGSDSLEDPVTAEGGPEGLNPTEREPELSGALRRPGKTKPHPKDVSKIAFTADTSEGEANTSAASRGSNPDSARHRTGPQDPLVRPGNNQH